LENFDQATNCRNVNRESSHTTVPTKHEVECYESFAAYGEGDELYAEMLQVISNAKKSIYLESYIFAADEIGLCFLSALQEKAAQGIDVRLHLDSAGTSSWLHGKFFKRAISDGIKLKWFHRWSWKNPFQFNVRNHRKILVVDGEKAFIGGFNIHNESSRQKVGDKRWLDFHVAIHHPIANQLERYFLKFWCGSRAFYPPWHTSNVYLVPNFSKKCRFRLRCEIANMLKSAQKSACVTTPYFVPDSYVLKHLVAAAKRGIRVELLVPRLSDNRLVDWAAKNYYTQLLLAGIEVYEYQPRMLHAKLIIVDDTKVMVGSANVDYRSLFVNFELVLIATNKRLTSELNKLYSMAKDDCLPVSGVHWQRMAWKWRVLSFLGYWFRRLL
jgi:cardiolipin synthase